MQSPNNMPPQSLSHLRGCWRAGGQQWVLRSGVPSPAVHLLHPGDAGQLLGILQAGEGGGKVHQSLLIKQIMQCDSKRLLSTAKRGCTTLPHRKKPAMRRQCCLTAQAAGRQGPAAAAGWGGQWGGDGGLGAGHAHRWDMPTCWEAACPPQNALPAAGRFLLPAWALPTAPSSLGHAHVGVARHGKL